MVEHSRDADKAELIAEIDRARARLSRSMAGLRRDADIGAHVKHSISNHKFAWLGSAGVAGWVLARLPGRRKKEPAKVEEGVKTIAETGLVLTALKLGFKLFRPTLMAFATKKITDIATKNNRRQK